MPLDGDYVFFFSKVGYLSGDLSILVRKLSHCIILTFLINLIAIEQFVCNCCTYRYLMSLYMVVG